MPEKVHLQILSLTFRTLSVLNSSCFEKRCYKLGLRDGSLNIVILTKVNYEKHYI